MAARKSRNNDGLIDSLFADTSSAAGLEPLTDMSSTAEAARVSVYDMRRAPESLNPYPLMKQDKNKSRYLELKMSIYSNGVQSPIILWDSEGDGHPVILSGHNRREACVDILEEHREDMEASSGTAVDAEFNEETYLYPPCKLYKQHEIDEAKAREIISDTNLQRDFSKMPIRERIMATKARMDIYENRRYSKGRTIDEVARDMGLKRASVYVDISIYTKVIPKLQELYYNGTLKQAAIRKIASLDTDQQEYIAEKYIDRLTDSNVKLLNNDMGKREIGAVLEQETEPEVRLVIPMPGNLSAEFKAVAEAWKSSAKLREAVEKWMDSNYE